MILNVIPFNKPYIARNSLLNIRNSMQSSHHSGDGPFSKKVSAQMSDLFGFENVLLTPSGTHALELGLLALDLTRDDEVIVPSFTFSSVPNAVILAGGTPVFADVSKSDLNLNVVEIKSVLTKRTKAVILVHYAGVACDLDEIKILADEFNFKIIEDNAHGIGAKYKNQNLGNIGIFSTFSFHETKNIQTGEGGAIVINDEELIERISVIREKGTNRKNFHLGLVDKYTWIDKGSSVLMSDLNASLLYSQLEEFKFIQKKRKSIWDFYYSHLSDWSEGYGYLIPNIPDYAEHNSHIFHIRLKNMEERQKFINHMRMNDVMSVFHYQALHESVAGKKYGNSNKQDSYENSKTAQDTLVRLPMFIELNEDEIQKIVKVAQEFQGHN
jgi:dTDP-4-amino-4,6-dideoxygalactose transaminase